jgi:hypothetical protein
MKLLLLYFKISFVFNHFLLFHFPLRNQVNKVDHTIAIENNVHDYQNSIQLIPVFVIKAISTKKASFTSRQSISIRNNLVLKPHVNLRINIHKTNLNIETIKLLGNDILALIFPKFKHSSKWNSNRVNSFSIVVLIIWLV